MPAATFSNDPPRTAVNRPTVRVYTSRDRAEWKRMRDQLFPGQSDEDMTSWALRLDATIIVAERQNGGLCGFAEVGARAYADGCETSPVAYLEGWWVDEDMRESGIGSALLRGVEGWARARGYTELASDAPLDNVRSQRAHSSLGFEEIDRVVQYRKDL